MSKIALTPNASGTGTFNIASPNSNTDRTLTLPDVSGEVLTTASTFGSTGPAFRSVVSGQSVPHATNTLVAANLETFDYGSRYNNTASTVSGIPAYSFMPDVAGVYMATLNSQYTGTAFNNFFVTMVYKNGSFYSEINVPPLAVQTYQHATGSDLVYLNGSTDYISFYVFQGQGSTQSITTVISAVLVREV